jgi:hypothetical protein
MNRLKVLAVLAAFFAVAIGAGVVIAALGDTETASGTITVSSESADLYICEPGAVSGPDCGPDDSDGDELVFESDELLLPGEQSYYDIRLKNVGDRPFFVTDYQVNVDEVTDPGGDCPQSALRPGNSESNSYYYYGSWLWILGKDGDPHNDNDLGFGQTFGYDEENGDSPIYIAPGDYEDVRLRVYLDYYDSINCDGNEWNVNWEIDVN